MDMRYDYRDNTQLSPHFNVQEFKCIYDLSTGLEAPGNVKQSVCEIMRVPVGSTTTTAG